MTKYAVFYVGRAQFARPLASLLAALHLNLFEQPEISDLFLLSPCELLDDYPGC